MMIYSSQYFFHQLLYQKFLVILKLFILKNLNTIIFSRVYTLKIKRKIKLNFNLLPIDSKILRKFMGFQKFQGWVAARLGNDRKFLMTGKNRKKFG